MQGAIQPTCKGSLVWISIDCKWASVSLMAGSSPTVRGEVLGTGSGSGLVNWVAMVSFASHQTIAF